MKNSTVLYVRQLLLIMLSVLLISCGSSDNDADSVTMATLSGTAAVGEALADRVVTVVNSDGDTVTTVTGSDGKFTIQVIASANPYMLKVETGGEPLFSFALAAGTVNISQLTNLALLEANKNGTTYSALEDLFSSFKDQFSNITEAKLNDAKSIVNATLAGQLSANGLANLIDFFSTAFDANSVGIDAVLDAVEVTIGSGGTLADITISIGGGNAFGFDPAINFDDFMFGDNGSGGSLSGTWNLVIAGTVSTATVGSFNIPAVTINNFPAIAVPTAGNVGQAEDAFITAFGAVGAVSDFSYQIVSSSDTEVVVTITGTVTIPSQVINGVTIPAITNSYNLTYTYTKQ